MNDDAAWLRKRARVCVFVCVMLFSTSCVVGVLWFDSIGQKCLWWEGKSQHQGFGSWTWTLSSLWLVSDGQGNDGLRKREVASVGPMASSGLSGGCDFDVLAGCSKESVFWWQAIMRRKKSKGRGSWNVRIAITGEWWFVQISTLVNISKLSYNRETASS